MSDALPKALRLLSHYARRAGLAEAAAEALCQQIERLEPDSLASRRTRDGIAELKVSALRIQAALEMEARLMEAMRVEHESVKERQHAAP